MGEQFSIVLNPLDWGQLLDGLQQRADSWRKTAEYLNSSQTTTDAFICEECSDVDEAIQIAEHYEKIITSIEKQITEQGGW